MENTNVSYDLIIIGAGPAGVSMAAEARTAGIPAGKILIFEKAEEHSFSIKKYYPANKLVTANYKGMQAVCTGVMCIADSTKDQTISYIDTTLNENGVSVRYAETVHAIHKFDDQRFRIDTDKGSYEARTIVIAIGILGRPNKPEYELPYSLKNRLLFDMTTTPIADAEVLVVGGGDSASEYCQYLVQQGNRVALSYRRKDFSRMNDINKSSLQALADRGAVTLLLETNVKAVKAVNGKPEVHFAEREPGVRAFDYVVYALGGTTPKNFLKLIGIEFDGEVPFVKEGYETNIPGMFLIGDLSAGTRGGSINWAFNSANSAMKRICENYLECTL